MYRPVGVFETEPTVSLISVQSNPREQNIWSSLAKYVKKKQIQLKHRNITFLGNVQMISSSIFLSCKP